MYHPIEGGTKIIVEGLEMYLPPTPPHKETANWNLPKEEQFWRRTPMPVWYEDKFEEEEERREDLVNEFGSIAELNRKLETGKLQWEDRYDFIDPKCEAFRKQEWSRRMQGYWFYNNGVPTYLIGSDYFYLNWCKLDVGYPDYYDFDRIDGYLSAFCEEDPKSLGYIKIGPRGCGKTVREVAKQLEKMTRPFIDRSGKGLDLQEYKAGIQSKTEEDAQKLFRDKMVNMYNSLPHFFKPISDHGSRPKEKMSFFRPAVKGKNAKKVKYQDGEELKATIQPYSCGNFGMDGESAVDIINDEIGKTSNRVADVYRRILVNRQVVYRNHKKYGIIRATSTVEELDKGGKECWLVWKNSDYNNRNANGTTNTGLYRWFLSAITANTAFIDKYGMVDEAAAEKWHQAECDARKDDPMALADFLRKNPKYIEHAFYADAKDCPFNQMILHDTESYLLTLKEPTGRFRLEWSGEPYNSDVELRRDDKGGHWYFSEIPKKDEMNKVQANGRNQYGRTKYKPTNTESYCSGTDPIDLGKVVDEDRASFPAILVKKRLNPLLEAPHPRGLIPGADLVHHVDAQSYMLDRPLLQARRDSKYQYKTGIYTGLYAYRPSDPNVYFEEVCKACWLFGMMVHGESQKMGALRLYMEMMGMQDFISKKWISSTNLEDLKKAEEHDGTAAGVGTINSYMNYTATFIEYFGHTLKHIAIVKQALKVKAGESMRKHDIMVGVGYTEMEDHRAPKAKPVEVNYGAILPTFKNNKGSWSRN